jgi:hypothetical protein
MTPKEIKAEARRRLREAGYQQRNLVVEAVIRQGMESAEDDDSCDIHPLDEVCQRIKVGEVMDLYVYDWSEQAEQPGLIANVTYPVGDESARSIVV